MRRIASILAVVSLLAAAGCSTEIGKHEVSSAGSSQTPVETRPEANLPSIVPEVVQPMPGVTPRAVVPLANLPKSIEESGAVPAAVSLAQQARRYSAAGHYDQAEAALGRALRLEPRNAFVWQALAAAHFAARKFEDAENEAQKSNSLGRGNPYIEMPNWRTIAGAREARGDTAGALQARAQADSLAQQINPSP